MRPVDYLDKYMGTVAEQSNEIRSRFVRMAFFKMMNRIPMSFGVTEPPKLQRRSTAAVVAPDHFYYA